MSECGGVFLSATLNQNLLGCKEERWEHSSWQNSYQRVRILLAPGATHWCSNPGESRFSAWYSKIHFCVC